MKTNRKIVSFFAVLGLFAMSLGVAAAEENGNNGLKVSVGGMIAAAINHEAKGVGSTTEVHISDNGKVLVRGAKVSAVSSSSITASNSWGSAVITWTVTPSTNAQFVRRFGGASALNEIQVGDFVSFSGDIDSSMASLNVKAAIIKDWSLQERQVFSGTVKSIDAANSAFVLTTSHGDINVKMAANATITKGGSTAAFADIQVGARLTDVRGVYNSASNTLMADSVKIFVNTALLEKRIFEGTVKAINGTTVPTTLVVTTENKDYTVNLAADTSILTNTWLRGALANVHIGDHVRIYGAVETQNNLIIDATVIRDTNLQ